MGVAHIHKDVNITNLSYIQQVEFEMIKTNQMQQTFIDRLVLNIRYVLPWIKRSIRKVEVKVSTWSVLIQ